MARIIESTTGSRRTIKMSVDDILMIVKEYQRIVPRFSITILLNTVPSIITNLKL